MIQPILDHVVGRINASIGCRQCLDTASVTSHEER